MKTVNRAIRVLTLFFLSFGIWGTTLEGMNCTPKLGQLSHSHTSKKSERENGIKQSLYLLPESRKTLASLEQYVKAPLEGSTQSATPVSRTLELAEKHLAPQVYPSFSDWLLGQFQEDPVVAFEDHYLGRQKHAYPAGPTRYNKNGERPFDGYLAARKGIDAIPTEKISLSDISRLHKEMMSRENYREDSGRIFQADRSFPRNSQNLRDTELGTFRQEGVNFDTDGKYVPSRFLAIAKPMKVVTDQNLLLFAHPTSKAKISYAPLSQWQVYDRNFHFSRPLVEKLRELSKKFEIDEIDSNQNPEINVVRQQMIQELTESVWKMAQEEIADAKTRGEAIQAAARFQRDFISIHPFYDGNGRVARILTEKLLSSRGLPSPIYPHWGEDVALTQEELEAHLARSVFMSDQYLKDLNKSLSVGKGYEEVLSPAVKLRILEILGDPTGDLDSKHFMDWIQQNRDQFQDFGEAVREFSKKSPSALRQPKPLSTQELHSLSSLHPGINPQSLAEEFQLWQSEKKTSRLGFEQDKTRFSQWLDRHTYRDDSGAVRLATTRFQRSFSQLSETEQQFQDKLKQYYGTTHIFRGVPTDAYVGDTEFVKFFAEQTALTTGNGVFPNLENVLPVFQKFNLDLLRNEKRLIKQVEGHAAGDDSRDQYDMSGMVSFTSNPLVAQKYQFSQKSDIGLLFTAKKRLVGSISTYKTTPSMDYAGYISEKEEALIGGVDPESFVSVQMQERGERIGSQFRLKRTKLGERVSHNKVRITETLFNEEGTQHSVKKSIWVIHSDGSVSLSPEQ